MGSRDRTPARSLAEWALEMDTESRLRPLLDQLAKHTPDRALLGRVQADLTDILEVCKWFEGTVNALVQRRLDRDQLESLLIDIEVNLLDHMAYHIRSVKRDMPALLKSVETPDSDEAGNPSSDSN